MTASNYEFPSLRYFKFTRPLLGSSGVVHVEMHRPEKMNAFIEPYVSALYVPTCLIRSYGALG